MARLVFDIETSALPTETFDPTQKEYLFREAEKLPDPAARESRRAELAQLFNLYPLTARIVCIAMLNADSQRRSEERRVGKEGRRRGWTEVRRKKSEKVEHDHWW